MLVLGSSLGTSGAMWDDQVAAFSERFRVLRFDTRGHGGSPAPPGPYTMDELGADVLALLDTPRDRALLVLRALAGRHDRHVARRARRPSASTRLVLCCTVPHFPPPELWNERDRGRARGGDRRRWSSRRSSRWLPPDVRAARPEAEAHLRALIEAVPAEGYAGCCEAIRDMDLRPRLASIEAPTLVLAGIGRPVDAVGEGPPARRCNRRRALRRDRGRRRTSRTWRRPEAVTARCCNI